MGNRIIKDIRFYESQTVDDNSYPDNLGKIFQPTPDTNYIGQRISRKLNELNFCYGEVDHIYINLTTALNENELLISNRNLDKRIKYIDYGLLPTTYNSLSDFEKNQILKILTFKILKHISVSDIPNMQRVDEVKILTEKFDSEIRILYKAKETSNYKIEVSYQISPINATTRAVIEYLEKKDNSKRQYFVSLHNYEDIYYLIDTIVIKEGILVLNPKNSYTATLCNRKYNTPIKFKI